ncbi:PilN domain-containing protein [Rhodopirellula sp. MGV]|uniref:PilN domain-containing protein n=1 Tax=Rhodopirellula sp. MGV TaxID=2023130 RepID=UPI000B95CB5F|nr:PilN domain-containing protein [Rhodopirellula sp. MGV]OYP34425.1 hypothetical protein CGZ80_15370 [Rhodopirellula sp. MGV]PNY37399.1 hypothetical protein C2E31_07650 [Rhodopirellula baltica]
MALRPPKDLLTAIGQDRAIVERRSGPRSGDGFGMRHGRRFDRRKRTKRTVGLEISPAGIALAYSEKAISDGTAESQDRLVLDRVSFPADSGPARGDWNDGTLQTHLSELVQRHGLAGQAVYCAIGGHACVTRVLSGTDQHVDNELTELAARTERYIGMGLGEKVRTEYTQRIDAKRKRVWVTVAMRDVVEAISAATRSTGLRLANLEHTMVVLCRVLHTCGRDDNEPVLLVIDDLGRMDLGISYKGRLLLDYRPALLDKSIEQGEVIQRHLKCLRRYVQSQVPEAPSDLQTVYVASISETNDAADRSPFPFDDLCEKLSVDSDLTPDSSVIAAIGLVRSQIEASNANESNNLVATLRSDHKLPWAKLLTSTWPIIAAAVVTFALLALDLRLSSRIEQISLQIDSYLDEVDASEELRATLTSRIEYANEVRQLSESVHKPRWAETIWAIGNDLPNRVWLESIQFHTDNSVMVVGISRSDDGVFEYLRRLRSCPLLTRVALQSTSAHRGISTTEVRFEVSAELAKPTELQNIAKAKTDRSTETLDHRLSHNVVPAALNEFSFEAESDG